MWLRAVALPVSVLPAIPQQLHAVARLGTRHTPHRHVPDLAAPRVRLQHSHHCSGRCGGSVRVVARWQAAAAVSQAGMLSCLWSSSEPAGAAAPHPFAGSAWPG